MKKNLVLLGMMGVGKTTLGKIVAKKLRFNFFDTDGLIEKQNSMLVKEIFEKKGEVFFRKEEEKIALNCLDLEKSIISLGGGAFINKKIRDKVLSDCVSIWLDLSIKNLSLRLNKNVKRPLLKKKSDDYIIVCKNKYEAKSLCTQITMGVIPSPIDNPLKYNSDGIHPDEKIRIYKKK